MALALNVDSNGITVKSFREVRTELAERFQGIFGQSIDLSPSSPDGQLLDLFVYAYSDAAEALQAVVSNLSPGSAVGVFLDNIGQIMGVARNGDDDDVYRARLMSSTTTGLATYDNMLTYLRSRIDSRVNLVANEEPTTDSNGIPGHCFAVYVPEEFSAVDEEGNDITDDYVATMIWKCKPAGIKAHGTSTGKADDVGGISHNVKYFKVSKTQPYYMRVTVTEYDEEGLPDNFEELVKDAIEEWAVGDETKGIKGEYSPGKDIIPKRVVQAVYKVKGIDDAIILVSQDGSSEWTGERIPVPMERYAYIPKSNITVTKVTGTT